MLCETIVARCVSRHYKRLPYPHPCGKVDLGLEYNEQIPFAPSPSPSVMSWGNQYFTIVILPPVSSAFLAFPVLTT